MTARIDRPTPESRIVSATGKFVPSRAQLMRSCRSGRVKPQVHMIEGESVTIAQIAARYGMAESTASRKLGAARNRAIETGGKVTWGDFK